MLKRAGWLALVMVLMASSALPLRRAVGAAGPTVWTIGTATKI